MIIEHKTLELFEKQLFEKAIVSAPFTIPQSMPNEACFIYVIDGNLDVFSAIDRTNVCSEEAVLMKCGNYIGQFSRRKKAANYHAIVVHFYPEILRKIYRNDLPSFLKKPLKNTTKSGMATVKAGELLKKYIDSMLFYFENPALVNEELLVLKIKELLLLLMNTSNASRVQQILSQLFSPQTFDFRETVEAHLYDNISIGELAVLTNLSLSSFKRKFKEIYAESPGQYLKTKKLEKAAELLLITNETISHIAYDCGFTDVAHLSRVFKSQYQLSPSQYRLNQIDKHLSQM